MQNLDVQYITDLVRKAQLGNSDAFAELYAATCQPLHRFAYIYLGDETLALDVLQETFIQALKQIANLTSPELFLSWLYHLEYKICFHTKRNAIDPVINPENLSVFIEGQEYKIRQLMNLPFSESQILLMKYCDQMKTGQIARLMNMRRGAVNRYLNRGKRRLQQILNH